MAAANRHGRLAAIQPNNLRQAEEWLGMGIHFVSWNTDIAVYRSALQKEIEELRKLTSTVVSARTAS